MLLADLRIQLSEGLIRRSSTTCSRWAENYIVLSKPIPGPLKFTKHPWSKEWHDYSGDWTGMKSAQMAMTASALNRALFTVDVLRNDVLYVLPKKTPDAADFSKAKFDILLNESPKLAAMFSNVRNVGHKQAGSTNLFIRGSRSRSQLKSISTGLIIFDELDEMIQKNISLALHRQTGYEKEDRQVIKISTPTFPKYGISEEIESTTKEFWMFVCPKCGRRTQLIYPDCLVLTADEIIQEDALRRTFIRCLECKRELEHKAKPEWLSINNARWEATAKSSTRGFQINKLYSMVEEPWEIAKRVILARTDLAYEQELWNSDIGLPHTPAAAKVADEEIKACIGNHRMTDPVRDGLVTMGIDVGHKVLYFNIDRWMIPPNPGPNLNNEAVPITVRCGTVARFEDLDPLMRSYNVVHAVIDVDPAFRDAAAFADRFAGRVNLCRFVRTVSRKTISISNNEGEFVRHVNRNFWIDTSQERYKRKAIILPIDLPTSYYKHITAVIKHQKRDDDGNIVYRYITIGASGDHFAFARVYSEIALPLAVSISENRNVQDFL